MHPTHDFGGGDDSHSSLSILGIFWQCWQNLGWFYRGWRCNDATRRMGRDGKLGGSTFLVRGALQCKCGCYPAISYNGSLSKPDPRTPVLMTCFCTAFSPLHKDFMGAKISFTVSFHKFYCISGFPGHCHFLQILWLLTKYCLQPNGRGKERRMLNASKMQLGSNVFEICFKT